nr:MAG TPA: hypothetical protein [Caudoviricetes sp.]
MSTQQLLCSVKILICTSVYMKLHDLPRLGI